MQKDEMNALFDVANAEEAGRNLAKIVVAFRDEITQEVNHGFPLENVNGLAVFFGKALIARVFLEQTSVGEELEEL